MAAIRIPELGTILSIWAHPDDETYLAGSVMAAAAAAGQRVVCISATAGEHGTGDPTAWPPERLGQVRRWEATAAMAILGVTEHHILGLPDGGLAAHEETGRALVGQLLDDVQPDTILTFGPDGRTFHPDHQAVHRWVTAEWARRGAQARLLHAVVTTDHVERFGPMEEELGVYMSAERPVAVAPADLALHVRADGSRLDQKVAALRAMATQTAGATSAIPEDLFRASVAEEAFVAAAVPAASSRAGVAAMAR
jgi:LmbE family N-acetylglucosaminyl deacetylase